MREPPRKISTDRQGKGSIPSPLRPDAMAIAPSTPPTPRKERLSKTTLLDLLSAENSCAGCDPLTEALVYHIGTGGGQTRAGISFEAGTALGLREKDSVLLAASVEFLHNASLVQDDLQDRSEKRRGHPSVWKKFGDAAAIGLTDYLIASSFQVLGGVSVPERIPALLSCIHDAILRTLKGQGRDLRETSPATVEECVEVAAAKSGPLFSLALELPLLTAGMGEHCQKARTAASAFGVGYQIYDDLDDFACDLAADAKSNLVLVLHEEMPLATARGKAVSMAMEKLSTASAWASTLPNGSGRELERLALILHARLEEKRDA